MKKYNSSKKRWASTVLMTGIILAGMVPARTVVNAVEREDSTVSTQTANNPKTGFEKITTNASAQKAREASYIVNDKETAKKEDKTVSNVKNEGTSEVKKETTTKNKKAPTSKKETAVPTDIYVGPTTDPSGANWDESTDYAAKSSTEYVSASGKIGMNDPVLYFGNSSGNNRQPFQPNSMTNNTGARTNNWAYTGTTNGTNLNPKKSYGIIIDGAIPADRGYGLVPQAGTDVATIESAVKNGQVTDYKLYKNVEKTGFKATMYDTKYNLSYTFMEIYDTDGGLYSYFSITNNAITSREIGAVEAVDTFVDADTVPIMSLGANAGFKLVGSNHTLKFKLDDPDGNRMGGWTNYTGGNINAKSGVTTNQIYNLSDIGGYFLNGALGTGMEATPANPASDPKGDAGNIGIYDIHNPAVKLSGTVNDTNSGFIIKAKPKMLAPGETLTNGAYLTYGVVQPGAVPVATAALSATNVYDDQTTGLKITGTVKDEDSAKGHIKITYPDKSTSSETDNTYNTMKVNTSVKYSDVLIDPSKLKKDAGVNEFKVAAVDDKKHMQEPPVKLTLNVIKLGATPIKQNIKVGGTVSTDEKDLIKDIQILNTTGHTLKVDKSNVDSSKVGHYTQDMLLTDTVVSPNKVAKIAIPVNVTDGDTLIDDTSAVYAHNFDVKTTDIAGLTDDELKAKILKDSGAKGWMVSTGADSAVSVKSTELKPASGGGTYKATITNAAGKEIPITITVAGNDLKIVSAPDTMSYGASKGVMLPYSSENFNLQRQDNDTAKVSISNTGQQGWELKAKVSKDLTSGANTLTGVLEYIDADGAIKDLDSGGATVGSGRTEKTKDVTWDAKQGIIANLNGANTSLKAGTYAGEITWTLISVP